MSLFSNDVEDLQERIGQVRVVLPFLNKRGVFASLEFYGINAFMDNLHSAHSVDVNMWDKDGRGNYWSDWKAIDADNNGIWDSPFVIRSQGDQDNFPLVNPPQGQGKSKTSTGM